MTKKITAEELAERQRNGEELAIIDVRENEEVTNGKIPHAINIPLGQLALRKNELDKEKTYVVVCQSGNRSKAACGILNALGFNVVDMTGGMNHWEGNLD